MTSTDTLQIIQKTTQDSVLFSIAEKVCSAQRISKEDCLHLYSHADLSYLGLLANIVRTRFTANKVFFNKNIHIEPTNICVHNCVFCSYSKKKGDPLCWEMSIEEMVELILKMPTNTITEVHIVGGCHPERGLDFYCSLLSTIHSSRPEIQIKAFTAVEIAFMAEKSNVSIAEVLEKLKESGLSTMPGGGAEIFNEPIRKQICPSKSTGKQWLEIHETAHKTGIPTNATMLYGHIETFENRVDHLDKLRSLQDKTKGFNAFIPLKYRKANNSLGIENESTWQDDLKNYAISRIYLDNFAHIKAYWPMLGKNLSQLTLDFGINDFDGTINDSTKIYSMAGAEEERPSMSETEMIELIHKTKMVAVERDSLYNEIAIYPL